MSSQFKFKDNNSSSSATSFESNQEVIQCTHCHTRYSVGSDKVSGLTNPKFHCFRCDNIFTITGSSNLMPKEKNIKKEENLDWQLGFNSNIKVKESQDDWKVSEEINIEKENSQMDLGFSIKNEYQNLVENIGEEKERFTVGKSLNPYLNYEPQEKVAKKQKIKFSLPKINFNIQSNSKNEKSNFTYLMLPFFIALAIIITLSIVIRNYPAKTSEILNFIVSTDAQTPPAGVGVRDLRIKEISLDNGENIRILEGIVYNNSSVRTNKVTLEGVLFDKTGNAVSRQKIALNANLSDIKLKTLNKELLSDMQKNSNKKIVLNPSDKHSFAIAFLDNSIQDIAYFSGRVYSIG